MAWSLVGSTSAAITAGAGTQDITLPGSPIEGDLVLVCTTADVSCANVITTSGYTVPENGTGANPGANFGYKVLGSTPDTIVTIDQDATLLRATVVQVWRGGYAPQILDAAITSPATGTSANPNSDSITTVNADSLVVTISHLDDDDATVTTTPTNYSNTLSVNTGQSSTTIGSTSSIASRVLTTAGAEDPGAWTMSSSDAWSASTIAFRISVALTEGLDTGRRQQGVHVPKRYIGAAALTIAANLLVSTLAPITGKDAQQQLVEVRSTPSLSASLRSITHSATHLIPVPVESTPVVQTEWPNPAPANTLRPQWSHTRNLAYEDEYPVGRQEQTPNPRQTPLVAPTWTWDGLSLTNVPEAVPVGQATWPESFIRGPRLVVGTQTRPSVDTLEPTSIPPVWQNPRPARPPDTTWTFARPFYYEDEYPAGRQELPQARAAGRPTLSWTQFEQVYSEVRPAHQDLWENPRRAAAPTLTWTQQPQLEEVVTAPPFTTDWPTPRGRRVEGTWTFNRPFYYEDEYPRHAVVGEVPASPRRSLSTWTLDGLSLTTETTPVPFGFADAVIRPRPAITQTWTQDRPFYYQDETPPTSLQWPSSQSQQQRLHITIQTRSPIDETQPTPPPDLALVPFRWPNPATVKRHTALRQQISYFALLTYDPFVHGQGGQWPKQVLQGRTPTVFPQNILPLYLAGAAPPDIPFQANLPPVPAKATNAPLGWQRIGLAGTQSDATIFCEAAIATWVVPTVTTFHRTIPTTPAIATWTVPATQVNRTLVAGVVSMTWVVPSTAMNRTLVCGATSATWVIPTTTISPGVAPLTCTAVVATWVIPATTIDGGVPVSTENPRRFFGRRKMTSQ